MSDNPTEQEPVEPATPASDPDFPPEVEPANEPAEEPSHPAETEPHAT